MPETLASFLDTFIFFFATLAFHTDLDIKRLYSYIKHNFF